MKIRRSFEGEWTGSVELFRSATGERGIPPPIRRRRGRRNIRSMLALRRLLVANLVLLLLGWGAVVRVAGAADESSTPCAFEADVSLSPGLSRSPSSGTFTTKGESGTLDCQGDVGGGQPATGRGTFGADGRY